MKFTWLDYAMFVWFLLLVIVSVIEITSGNYNPWVLPVYLVVWSLLMMIKTLIEKR